MALPPPDSIVGNSQYGGQFSTQSPLNTGDAPPAIDPTGKKTTTTTTTTSGGGTPYVPGPIPNIDIYANAEVMANNAYNNALLQLNQNRMNTLTQYGYRGTVDPTTGVVTGVNVDPNSMYGQLQQLLHGQAVEDESAMNAAQDRGLIGGLANQARSELQYAHGGQDTALGLDLQGKLSDFQAQQQAAAETRDNTLWQAQQAQLQAEMQAEYNQQIADLVASLAGGGGGGTTTTTTTGDGTNPGVVPQTTTYTGGKKPIVGPNIFQFK